MESSGTQQTPAGWYPDPQGEGLRWWDGSAWSEHTHPGVAQQSAAPESGAAVGAAEPSSAQPAREQQAASAPASEGGSAGASQAGGASIAPAATPAPGQPTATAEPDGPTNGDWGLAVLLGLLAPVGLVWGAYVVRQGDRRKPAGNLAIVIALLVILGAVLALQLG